VLGGTSSIGSSFLRILALEGIATLATCRTRGSEQQASETQWLELDLASRNSCERFALEIRSIGFRYVVLFIGALSVKEGKPLADLQEVEDYVTAYVARYIWVLDAILSATEPAPLRLLHVSSRASRYGSWDQYYSASKSAMEAALRSFVRKHSNRVEALSVATGLIEGSKMALSFSSSGLESHRTRSENSLWDVKELSDSLKKVLFDQKLDWDGRVIELGPSYE